MNLIQRLLGKKSMSNEKEPHVVPSGVLGRARFWSCAPHSKRLFLCILNIVSYGFGSTRGQGPRLSIRPTGRNFFLSLSEMWHMSKPVKKGLHFSNFWVILENMSKPVILETCPNLWWRSCSKCYAIGLPSVHTWNMSKPVMTFVFKVLRNRLLRYILQTCPNPGSQWGNTHHCLVGAIEIYLHDPMLHCLGRTQNMQIPYTYNICLWFMHIISRGSSKAYPQDDNLIHCYESPRWFFVPVGFLWVYTSTTPRKHHGLKTVRRNGRYPTRKKQQPSADLDLLANPRLGNIRSIFYSHGLGFPTNQTKNERAKEWGRAFVQTIWFQSRWHHRWGRADDMFLRLTKRKAGDADPVRFRCFFKYPKTNS